MPVDSLPVDYLFTLKLGVGAKPRMIKNGPQGTRIVAGVDSGTFEGPSLKGTVVPPGGDWVTSRANRVAQLDVRLLLVTDDDATILMQYKGIADFAKGQARSAPQFETGDERYAWLNDVQGVGLGQLAPDGGVSYDVYGLR